MSEPLDDELRAFVGAFQEVERPTAAARAATWAAIDARVRGEVVPLRRPRAPWTLAAMAAAVVLCLGLAAAVAWRGRVDSRVEAIHQHMGGPALRAVESRVGESRGGAIAAPVSSAADGRSAESVEAAGDTSVTDALGEFFAKESEVPDAGPGVASNGVESRATESPRPEATGQRESSPAPGRSSGRRRPRPANDGALRPEEVASFQRAQAALADGRHEEALRALDDHGRRFPGGLFEEERLVSRAAALCKLGRVAEAAGARDRFLRERSTSHLGERMRQICREIP